MNILNVIVKKIKSVSFLLKRRRWYPLLKIDMIRFFVCKIRKFYFIKLKKQLTLWNGSQANLVTMQSGDSTIEHNLKGLHDISCARSLRIIKPLSVIELFRPLREMPLRGGELNDLDYPCNAKVLTIGPRTEGEIFCLIAYGFEPKNIRGLDLISYSPFIDVGDMHQMPYPDNSFDIVICSCVLVYSKNPQKASEEIIRVCKPGGLICISQDTVPDSGDGHIEALGKQTLLCEDYLTLFKKNVRRVFFQHELPERLAPILPNEGANYTTSLIFQIQKDSNQTVLV